VCGWGWVCGEGKGVKYTYLCTCLYRPSTGIGYCLPTIISINIAEVLSRFNGLISL